MLDETKPETKDEKANLEIIKLRLEYAAKGIERIDEKLEKSYVTQDQFAPVRNLVFGMVVIILVAVIGALVALVIQK